MPAYKDISVLAELGFNQEIIASLEPLLISVQIDENQVHEFSFRPDRSNNGIKLLYAMADTVAGNLPFQVDIPADKISYHPPDNLSYPNPTIVIAYTDRVPKEVLEYFGVPDTINPRDVFSLKFDLTDHTTSLKLYDANTRNYRVPNTPEGAIWGEMFGIGRSFSRGGETNHVLDFYYGHRERAPMQEFLGETYPWVDEDFDVNGRGYAICVDEQSGRIVSAKRYLHLADPGLFHPLAI